MSQELNLLVGEPLSAVCFVMDYVEFHFDGRILRSLANPTVDRSGISIMFGQLGARDALCGLIADTVTQVRLEDEIRIEVHFHSGAVLKIPIDEASRHQGEAAHFRSEPEKIFLIW